MYYKLQELQENPSLILEKIFMINFFEEYQNELPPFKEYGDLMYDKKKMKAVSCTDGSSVVHYNHIRKCLFHPMKQSDVETTNKVIELSEEATEALVHELLDEKEATYKYLSVSESEYSAAHDNFKSRQETLLGVHATNDEAESVLGGITSNVQKHGRINLSSAGAVSDTKWNKFLSRGKGWFHEFDEVIRECITCCY